MSAAVRRYGASIKGLARPLPVPDRFFRQIQMDFITDLPLANGNRCLWVIKDRLSKEVILEPMPTMEAEACAERFLWCFARYHWWPDAITSDRGSELGRPLLEAHVQVTGDRPAAKHGVPPQTDGGPERMNQEVQAYLRAVINQNQNDWISGFPRLRWR
ncbi:integrase core domain-containing protein [Hirsutella rhossiliensis]|uniref:Integrase core domain-containing protein n=1 Tax=Hirsutella rhossiliensis TaxID=111463 RepID=A0A9P8ML24_9HYPO|nr:integrase core domain-containing protein [Hirsutella rhossiliensis]KAH0956979.1 integrase core domain-containing protein [Hirsutella rhossiliensis]